MRFLCLHGRGTNSEVESRLFLSPFHQRSLLPIQIFGFQTSIWQFLLRRDGDVPKTSLAALRYELGNHHVYEFVEGSVPCDPAPGDRPLFVVLRKVLTATLEPQLTSSSAGVGNLSSSNDGYFQYFDDTSLSSYQQLIEDVESYVASEGPFDAVMAFSQGTIVAWGLMTHRFQLFACAIFFPGGVPGDPSALLQGKMQLLDRDTCRKAIHIPTAHVWGEHDLEMPENGQPLSETCDA